MDYRVLDSAADFDEALNLEVAVWGLAERDAVPVSLLRALTHGGGSLLGAYDSDKLIGIALGFPARRDDQWILWSHMTGVQRSYRGQNVGFELKRYQREWALVNGFTEIRWTFDPLQRGNANFNIHRLGATAEQYHVNFYGTMHDEINHAELPSDRIESIWRLNDPQVAARLAGDAPETPALDRPFALANVNGTPQTHDLSEQPEYLVQIPHSLRALSDLTAPAVWRLALRKTLSSAFSRGYAAVDFTSADAYLLQHL